MSRCSLDGAFRPSTVDGWSHQNYADGSAVTIVNFKVLHTNDPGPERWLFDFLIRNQKPRRVDKRD